MKKVPCLVSDTGTYVLLKDFQDFNGWVILYLGKTDVLTKADKRIKGDANMAEAKFKELYGYSADFSYKSLKEVL